MGNTFPSKKRIPERVHSPAFLLWCDPLFPSEIKGSRQIKNAFLYREKWRARTVGECYPCHETVPQACWRARRRDRELPLRGLSSFVASQNRKESSFRRDAETSTPEACAPQNAVRDLVEVRCCFALNLSNVTGF